MQLLTAFQNANMILSPAYFIFSFTLLVVRLVSVCCCGSLINEEYKKILPNLTLVQANFCNIEVRR